MSLMLRLFALVFILVPLHADAQIIVAAASDLQVAFPELAKRFQQATRIQVQASFGSSGTLAAQIENGAPFDVFLSADVQYPERLAERGLAERGAVVRYAVGRIVLWAPKGSSVDLSRGLRGLAVASINRVAIANASHAPYGRAAVAALQHEGVYEQLRSRLVFGENISQTAQFARSGNADAAIIALSLAIGPSLRSTGTHAEIPSSWHAPIEQGAVWLRRSKNPAAAKRFVAFLQEPATAAFLRTMGFEQVRK